MTYCYSCECGNKTEKNVPMSDFAKTVECEKCGKLMGIDPAAQKCKTPGASCWPMESDAMGVHPAQAKEYSDYLKEKGVPTEINSDGNPVLTSRHHRKLVCAATDTYDRNAGFGDQSRQTPLPERTPRTRSNR